MIPQVANTDAWQMLLDDESAVLIDVRTETEWRSIGVPDTSQVGRPARFIAWNDEQGIRNPYFVDQATDGLDPDTPILLLCRSGARSNAAAEFTPEYFRRWFIATTSASGSTSSIPTATSTTRCTSSNSRRRGSWPSTRSAWASTCSSTNSI